MTSSYISRSEIIDTIDHFMRSKKISYHDLTKCKVIDLINHDVSFFVGKTFIEPQINFDRYKRKIRTYKICGKLICKSSKCYKQCSLKRTTKFKLYFSGETNKIKGICFDTDQELIFYDDNYDEDHDDHDDDDDDDDDNDDGYEAGDERYPHFLRESYRKHYIRRRGGKTKSHKNRKTRKIRRIKKNQKTKRTRR
jgi:hypothetical protein